MAVNSSFGQLFIAISDRIQAAVPEIKWIDQDFGQLENFTDRPPVNFPCALIDFPIATYSGLSGLAQLADATIQVRLGFAPFSNSNNRTPAKVREEALKYYAIEQKIYEALQGFQTEFCQPLIRINAGTEQRLSANDQADSMGMRVRVLNFSTQFEDQSNAPVYNQTTATLETESEIDV